MIQKNQYLRNYFETILQIIEDKPSFIIPNSIYCTLIIVYYFQISGYIFSTYEIKPLEEEKIKFIAHLSEISPMTFLLYYSGIDLLTIIVFTVMNFCMYFYFMYTIVLSALKIFHPHLIKNKFKQI